MSDMMHVEDCRMINHGTRNTALFFERYAHMVKPGERAYYLAMCRLIAEDPDMFRRHAFDGAGIRFCDFRHKGKTISYCRAYYAVRPVSPGVCYNKPNECRYNIVNRPARGVQSQEPRNGEPNRMHTT